MLQQPSWAQQNRSQQQNSTRRTNPSVDLQIEHLVKDLPSDPCRRQLRVHCVNACEKDHEENMAARGSSSRPVANVPGRTENESNGV